MALAGRSIDADTSLEARRAALAASPLFRALRAEELQAVLRHAPMRRFARGTVVYRRGDPGTGMLLVLRGRLRVGVTGEDGREITLAILGPGDSVGEMTLLDGSARSADVTTMEACSVLSIERAQFIALLRNSSDLCLRIIEVLSSRLRTSNAAFEERALLGLAGRVGRLLLRLARDYGTPAHDGGIRLDLRMSQKDMSALVGASREKVNRQLRIWEMNGTITKQDGYIVVRQPDVLAGADSVE